MLAKASSTMLSLILLLFLALPAAAQVAPTDFVRQKVDELSAILRRDVTRGTDAYQARLDDLKTSVRNFIDYRELCRRALDTHWDERTPEEQDAFVDLMTRLIETNYAVKMSDQRFDQEYEVDYEDERVRNSGDDVYATVSGTVNYEEEEYLVEVRMLQRDATWVVWDVVTDDVSLMETYAESFDDIIYDEGYDALVQRLEDRVAELEAELDALNQPPTP
jgi:phospholipid transport system substrate-binding protein